MKTKTFFIADEDTHQIIDSLINFLISEKYHIKKFYKKDGFTLNVYKSTPIKTLFGLKEEFNINLRIYPNAFTISFSEISWVDKVLIGSISYLIFPLLLLFPLYGFCKQMNVTKTIIHYLNTEIDIKLRKNHYYSEIFS